MPTKPNLAILLSSGFAIVLASCFNPDLSAVTVLCSAEAPECPEGRVCDGTTCVDPAAGQGDGMPVADGSLSVDGQSLDMANPCGPDVSNTPARRLYFVAVENFSLVKSTVARCGAGCYHAYSGDNVDKAKTPPAGFYFVDTYASFLGANQSCSYFGNPVILRGFGDLAGSTKAYPACAATPAAIVADGTKSGVYCSSNSATTCAAPLASRLGVVVECK